MIMKSINTNKRFISNFSYFKTDKHYLAKEENYSIFHIFSFSSKISMTNINKFQFTNDKVNKTNKSDKNNPNDKKVRNISDNSIVKNEKNMNHQDFDSKFKKNAESQKKFLNTLINDSKIDKNSLIEFRKRVKDDYKKNKFIFFMRIFLAIFIIIKSIQINRYISNSTFYIDNAEIDNVNNYEIKKANFDEYLERASKRNDEIKTYLDNLFDKNK